MKILTKEQEQAHYRATLQGGILGGVAGLGLGAAAVLGASRRYAFFRGLTLPLKTFLVTSAGTFCGIISADHASRTYEREQNPIDVEYAQRQKQIQQDNAANKTFTERAMEFGKRERYKIVGGSWLASMFAAFSIVNRNKFLTGQQKLVQARVYAQFLTLGVLVATAAFELSDRGNEEGRYETIKVIDPTDPDHKRMIEKRKAVESDAGDSLWKDMVAAEEERMKEREEDEKKLRAHHQKKSTASKPGKKEPKKSEHKEDKSDKKDEKDSDDNDDDGESVEKSSDADKGKESKTAQEDKKQPKGKDQK